MTLLQPLPPGHPMGMGVVTDVERWWTKVGPIKDSTNLLQSLSRLNTQLDVYKTSKLQTHHITNVKHHCRDSSAKNQANKVQ